MFSPSRQSALRAFIFVWVLLLPGTPYIVSAEEARDSLIELAALAQQSRAETEEGQARVGGAPPAVDELRSLSQAPTLSGANPPYPRNHVLDGDLQSLGTPPGNHSFESSPTSTGTPPSNSDIESAPSSVGTPPTNNDFETGDFTGWATSGSVVIDSDTPHGYYAKLSGTNATLTSSAFTVDSAAQVFSFDAGWLTTNNYSWVKVYVLSGTGYSTQTEILSKYCYACGYWEDVVVDASAWLGQSIELKFLRSAGDVGINDVEMVELLPDLTPAGTYSRKVESSNALAELVWGATLTTDAFTVASDAQLGSVDLMGRTTFTDQYKVEVLSGGSYATATTVASGDIADSWATIPFMLAEWQGESVKLRIKAQTRNIGVDNIGLQIIELPDWELDADAEIVRVDNSGEHYVRLAWGEMTSAAFTVDAAAQQLTIQYRAGSSASNFYVEVLHGTNYSETTSLGLTTTNDQTNWQTFTSAIDDWAGESIKLRIDQSFGWGEYDLVGLEESLLPGWSLGTLEPLALGEDSYGSYVTPIHTATAIYLESSLISTGIIDDPYRVDQRYYAIAYDIGHRTGSTVTVTWYEDGTSNSWVVYSAASNTPTGYTVGYFWLADFTGTDGYFEVKIADNGGKFYSIADNIARVQLSEPYSEKVGQSIDTSTGSFGYQETDIRTEGLLPLNFTRYYAGHSDHYGAMGFRWRHTYDIRLEVTNNDDAGVIFGSGREVFFDEDSGLFEPADVRVHDELVKNQDDTYTYTTSTNLIYDFDADGVLQTISDLNDNQITLTYNGSNQLTTITGLGNQEITLAYDGNGRLSTVTDPESEVWTYTYNGNGDLITVTDPDSGEREYQYSRHRLTTAINPLDDVIFKNVFDDWNRVIEQEDANQNTITIDYDTPGQGATEVTDPEGNTATFYFDEFQRTSDQIDPLGHTISRIYDADGNLIRIIDPAFGQWDFAYSGSGDLTSLEDPLGNDVQVVYNAEHLPTTITDARNNTATYTYDGDGNVLTKTDPLNNTWTYTYDSAGDVLTETDPLNNTTTFTYDAAGNVLTKTDPLNNTWTYTYDSRGRLLTETDALNNTTTYSYNWAGWLSEVEDPLGHTMSYTYSLWGDLLEREDELGNTVSWTYDSNGWVTSRTDEAGYTTTYSYDANGNAIAIENALGEETTYTYDENNRLVAITDPLNNTTTYTYDANGKLASETDPLGRVTSYAYDDSGRLTSSTLPNLGVWSYTYDANSNLTGVTYSGGSISHSYDALDRRTSMTDATGTTTWSYDADSQVTSVAAPNGTVGYSYNAAGQRASMTLPGSRTLTYAYDGAGRTSSATDWLSNTISFGYDVDGRRTSITRPNGVTSNYGYDAAGRVTTIDHSGVNCQCTLQSFAYTYDAEDNRTSVTTGSGTENYTLDALNRLTQVVYANNDTVDYTYDSNGNRLTTTLNSNQIASYSYDAADRLTSDGSISYSYDAAGNLTAAGTSTYSWDWANRLSSATVNSTTESYSYDGDGTRVSATVGGATTPYVWDRLGEVELLVDDGANAYINFGGQMAQIDSGNTVTYPLLDGLGSVRGLTDPNENLVGTADYSAFGEVSNQTGATSIFGFTGEQHDAVTEQVYLRARYLMPGIGRFSAADTVQPNAPGTQGYNRYSYVANNPSTWIDPTGHNAAAATAGTALVLSPFWYGIATAIAEFFLAAACATGCIVVLVAIIIIALIVAACVLGAFGHACYMPTTQLEVDTRVIPGSTTHADPDPRIEEKPKPLPNPDDTQEDPPSCEKTAANGEWVIQLPSGNPGLRQHLIDEGHAPWTNIRNKGRWNRNSWNGLDGLITEAMEGGDVGVNPNYNDGQNSFCVAFFTATSNVGFLGSGKQTKSYAVYFELDGFIRSTYPVPELSSEIS